MMCIKTCISNICGCFVRVSLYQPNYDEYHMVTIVD